MVRILFIVVLTVSALEAVRHFFGGSAANIAGFLIICLCAWAYTRISGGERIVSVAVLYRTPAGGDVVAMLRAPARHGDVLHAVFFLGGHKVVQHEVDQGFLTDTGRFVDRKEGWDIAKAAGQLLGRAPTDHQGGTLYSEDVW